MIRQRSSWGVFYDTTLGWQEILVFRLVKFLSVGQFYGKGLFTEGLAVSNVCVFVAPRS